MKIGTIKGIQIKIHISTWIIVFLVAYNAGIIYNIAAPNLTFWEYFVFGILSGLMVLFSILAHELLHSITAKRRGLNVSEIEFFMFGGVSKITEEPRTPEEEIKVAIVGPLLSIILGGIFYGISLIQIPYSFQFFFSYASTINIVLGLFNLLPAYPMDGGRVLRGLIWRKRKDLVSATQTASKIGEFFGGVMIFFGFIEIFFFGFIDGIWWILIGSFLRNSAQSSMFQILYFEKLSKCQISSIIPEMAPSIPRDMDIQIAVQNYFLRSRRVLYPIVENDKIVGVVSIREIQEKYPYHLKPKIVGDIMFSLENLPVISKYGNCKDAFTKISEEGNKHQIIVVKDPATEKIIGFLEENDFRIALSFSSFFEK